MTAKNTRAKAATEAANDAPAPRGRGRPSKRGQKREALLEGATALFNARGISAISLAEVAEAVGLTRATVYYYVSDRADLVFQCYMRACELVADDLAAAAEAANGFERTLAFIRLALTPSRPPTAVLTEIGALDAAHAEVIGGASARNTAALTSFIEAGMADGSVRPCDAQVAAQAIIGMLAWTQLLPHWSRGADTETRRARAAQTMIDLLTHGLARDRSVAFHCGIDASRLTPTLVNAFDRRESSSLKLMQVLAAASRLFNRNGIEATSLDEIAASMGVTKGVLYHYFDDKSDLVTRCYERSFEIYEQFVTLAKAHGDDGFRSALINAHLNIQGQVGSLSPLMPQPGFGAVPEEQRATMQRRAAQENRTVSAWLQSGIDDGVANPLDAPLVTHIIAGAFGWLPKWLPPDRPQDPIRMADKIMGMLLTGLRA
ncbi:TetR/AcrR family transcriptional regulator, partial [Phenylobacterium sp.]|uniref:TetR/AcrR family transcriptional regulator n=1 Tax=Phenylobacterium sp. TaxID=1871053 RepID=UPI0025D56272